jgi:ribosomal protein S18 acetylase RimI-like enzyme
MVEIRPYDPGADREGLWACKAAFERAMGGTGDDAKAAAYEDKLSESYRHRYLEWVEECIQANPECVQVADTDGEIVGYVFVLPEAHAMIWDAAVLNEIFLAPAQRGTGVADELMAAGLSVARAQSLPLERIILDVDEENERARAFYDRHGFEPWGEIVAREL